MYFNLVGGVLALNLDQLNETNGFSNLYWGWGAEGKFSLSHYNIFRLLIIKIIKDDDMSMRILHNGYKITRPTNSIGRYKMVLHNKRSRAINRFLDNL